jgi:hypothetical protein
MQWWSEFWTWVNENQLPATVIGGAIVALLIWLVSALPKIGPRVRAAIRWIWSWRPVSYRRHTRDLTRQKETTLAELGELLRIASGRTNDSMQPVLNNAASAGTQANVLSGLAIATGGPATDGHQPRVIPSPQPRWRLEAPQDLDDSSHDGRRYSLRNLIENSVAKNVRIENSGNDGYFDFEDGAFWPDLSGLRSGGFNGAITRADPQGDVRLRLSYFDGRGEERNVYYLVNRNGRVRQLSDEELAMPI